MNLTTMSQQAHSIHSIGIDVRIVRITVCPFARSSSLIDRCCGLQRKKSKNALDIYNIPRSWIKHRHAAA